MYKGLCQGAHIKVCIRHERESKTKLYKLLSKRWNDADEQPKVAAKKPLWGKRAGTVPCRYVSMKKPSATGRGKNVDRQEHLAKAG